MEHMYLLRPAHDHVANARDNIDPYAPVHAVFQDDVPVMAVDARQKDRIAAVQHGKAFQTFLYL